MRNCPRLTHNRAVTHLLRPTELVSTVDFGLKSGKQSSQAQTCIHGITCISTGHHQFLKSNIDFFFCYSQLLDQSRHEMAIICCWCCCSYVMVSKYVVGGNPHIHQMRGQDISFDNYWSSEFNFANHFYQWHCQNSIPNLEWKSSLLQALFWVDICLWWPLEV